MYVKMSVLKLWLVVQLSEYTKTSELYILCESYDMWIVSQ